jgi:hypothetical protein
MGPRYRVRKHEAFKSAIYTASAYVSSSTHFDTRRDIVSLMSDALQ